MAHPVDLHCKPRLGAIEVEHIGSDRVLATEKTGDLLASYAVPTSQPRLRRRRLRKRSRRARGDRLCRRSHGRKLPPPRLRAVPSPASRGRITNSPRVFPPSSLPPPLQPSSGARPIKLQRRFTEREPVEMSRDHAFHPLDFALVPLDRDQKRIGSRLELDDRAETLPRLSGP